MNEKQIRALVRSEISRAFEVARGLAYDRYTDLNNEEEEAAALYLCTVLECTATELSAPGPEPEKAPELTQDEWAEKIQRVVLKAAGAGFFLWVDRATIRLGGPDTLPKDDPIVVWRTPNGE